MATKDSVSIRHKLYDYIRLADDKRLYAIYSLLEGEIEEVNEWWKEKGLVDELDKRYEALESGADRGFTIEQVENSISKLRKKRYAG